MATKKPARKGKTTRKRKSRKAAIAGAPAGLAAQVQRLQRTVTANAKTATRLEKAAKAHEAANRKQEQLNNATARIVGRGARKKRKSSNANVRQLYAA